MNAGAHGFSLSDILVSATLLDTKDGSFRSYEKNELRLGYRHSLLMENSDLVCLDVTLSLQNGNRDEIARRMKEYRTARNQSQPLNVPSAGSYFKRPREGFAGKLIEDCGLKGLRVGDAAVSEKHAGFIVNLGNASCEDILKLEEKVREEVSRKFGVTLEREVLLLPREGKEG